MSGKRRDHQGRVLRTGESQRSDGRYMYRYTGSKGKRGCIYEMSLERLRQREDDIKRDTLDGIDTLGGEMTVEELVKRYINLKRGWKENTRRGYETSFKRIQSTSLSDQDINHVKLSDAKTWCVMMHDQGYSRSTIEGMQCLLRPAFEMAVEDDLVRKNPFRFKLCTLLPNDAVPRVALTAEQQDQYLRFVREYGGDLYYDDIVILLGTGLRVSERYGLTKADIDFEGRCIHICKQLCRTSDMPYFITEPKTKTGIRTIPMTDTVFMAFKRVLANRPKHKVETIVDGCGGFIFLDKDKKPRVGMHLQNYMRLLREHHPWALGGSFPTVTPHVLRHTFCTNMVRLGIDVKSLQYLMGHSSASVTLDVYTHTDYSAVKEAFDRAVGDR